MGLEKSKGRTGADLDEMMSHNKRGQELMATGVLIPRDCGRLKDLLDAMKGASLDDFMDKDGVLVGSAMRDEVLPAVPTAGDMRAEGVLVPNDDPELNAMFTAVAKATAYVIDDGCVSVRSYEEGET